jgi:HlyD family secretion protein
MLTTFKNRLIPIIILAIILLGAWQGWKTYQTAGPGEGFVSGNGRIEATEINIATPLGGRLENRLVKEGDFVTKGQELAYMQSNTLLAQRNLAMAQAAQANAAVASAQSQVAMRQSDLAALKASQIQAETQLESAQRRFKRSSALAAEGSLSDQVLDDDKAALRRAEAAINVSKAEVSAGQAAIKAAEAQVTGAMSSVNAAQAAIESIDINLADSVLVAPRDGRVQFVMSQPGEVLAPGGKVVNMVDLSDVYMTFFLPETVAGKIALGQEVRLVLDVAPDSVIPATVSFVASIAQFTPKTVETASERQKLMFRVRARISPQLLKKYITQVKTGLPGVAWLRIDEQSPWPDSLTLNISEE